MWRPPTTLGSSLISGVGMRAFCAPHLFRDGGPQAFPDETPSRSLPSTPGGRVRQVPETPLALVLAASPKR